MTDRPKPAISRRAEGLVWLDDTRSPTDFIRASPPSAGRHPLRGLAPFQVHAQHPRCWWSCWLSAGSRSAARRSGA